MTEDLVIVGCGGHGREVFAIVQAVNARSPRWQVTGFVDDAPTPENLRRVERLGARVLGDLSAALRGSPARFVIGIGTGAARARIDQELSAAGWRAATIVHPDSSLGVDVELGPGSIVWAGVRAATNVRCGRHVHLNHNVTIGHDSVLGDYATLNPQAAISGGVDVGAHATVGASATVLQYLSVGANATVGAGAVAVSPVSPGATVKGVPAR